MMTNVTYAQKARFEFLFAFEDESLRRYTFSKDQ